jgi:hypothetical protein
MASHKVKIKQPTTLGELACALNRIVFLQSMVANGDVGYSRLLEFESRLPAIRESLQVKLGKPIEEADPKTHISRSFSKQLLRQLTH